MLPANVADLNIEIMMEMLIDTQRELETERAARSAAEEKLAAAPAIVPQKLRAFKVTVTERDENERVKAVSIST